MGGAWKRKPAQQLTLEMNQKAQDTHPTQALLWPFTDPADTDTDTDTPYKLESQCKLPHPRATPRHTSGAAGFHRSSAAPVLLPACLWSLCAWLPTRYHNLCDDEPAGEWPPQNPVDRKHLQIKEKKSQEPWPPSRTLSSEILNLHTYFSLLKFGQN